jgi:hypothetical protein
MLIFDFPYEKFFLKDKSFNEVQAAKFNDYY